MTQYCIVITGMTQYRNGHQTAEQRCVHRSKTCCQTDKHFDNVIFICCENVVEVYLSLTTSFFNDGHTLFSGDKEASDY
jgi:hypothetical protein